MTVLQYAIETLKVQHVIVCGHTCCGGVHAAFGPELSQPLEGWISSVRVLRTRLQNVLDTMNETDRWRYLCEENVKQQVIELENLDVIQQAWARGQSLSLHGIFYDIDTGLLKDMQVSKTLLQKY